MGICLFSTLLSSSISPFLCYPPPVRRVHFGIVAIWGRITVKATLRCETEILGVGWLRNQPSHAFDDVSTAELDRALVIVIRSHILESWKFPLHNTLIIWPANHELLYTVTSFDAWEKQSGVFFLQQVVIVPLHTTLLDPTLQISVLFTSWKWVVVIDL
jgi:hypothetical protein